MNHPPKSLAIAFAILGALLLSVNLGRAEPVTPVAASPHHVSLAGERAWSGIGGISGDGYYNESSEATGVAAGYLYQSHPSLEWGGRASYRHTDYAAYDQLFIAGQVRVNAALDSARRADLGLSVSAGLLTAMVPDIPDADEVGERAHYYLGPALGLTPELRYWVSPSWALTLGANAEAGVVHDVVQTEGNCLISDGYYLHIGGQLGVVAAL